MLSLRHTSYNGYILPITECGPVSMALFVYKNLIINTAKTPPTQATQPAQLCYFASHICTGGLIWQKPVVESIEFWKPPAYSLEAAQSCRLRLWVNVNINTSQFKENKVKTPQFHTIDIKSSNSMMWWKLLWIFLMNVLRQHCANNVVFSPSWGLGWSDSPRVPDLIHIHVLRLWPP